MPFVDKPVFAKNEAVVTHVHNEGLFGEIVAFEVLNNAADALIDTEQSFAITTVKSVEVHLAVVHVVHAVPTIALLFDPAGFAFVVFFSVSHALGIFEFDIIVFAMVSFGRFEHGVNGFMGEIEEERPVLVAVVLEPVESVIGEQVGDVALAFHAFAIDVEGGIEIDTLAFEADPFVETGTWFVAGVTHVPFAHEGGLPAGFLQVLGKKAGTCRDAAVIVNDTVSMGELAGEDTGAAGRT